MTFRLHFHVKAIIDGPMEAKSLVGQIGKLVEIDELLDRPVLLEIHGRKFAFRLDEVETYHPGKAYPFGVPLDENAWKGTVIE